MVVQVVGDESIFFLSELVRVMYSYCLLNFIYLILFEDEFQEQLDDLILFEDCVVLEIVGQVVIVGNDLEILVVVRQIFIGFQFVFLGDLLEVGSVLQLFLFILELETEVVVFKEVFCFEKEGLLLDLEEKLELVCLSEFREVMELVVFKGFQNLFVNVMQSFQRVRKGRRKKSKEQLVVCVEGYVRRLRLFLRGQFIVVIEVIFQVGNLFQEEF